MTEPPNQYTIQGGVVGYNRLLLLSRLRWPDTASLFRKAGVGPGMRCVDIGCGSGTVTLEIGRLTAPSGSVVGIDMDEVKINLASETAREQDLRNIEFRCLRVEEWDEPYTYDVCYSRYVLQHLRAPVDLLRRMWAALRPGGLLLIEDTDWEGWSSDPPNDGIDFLRNRYIRLLERRGCDPRIGLRLYRHFLEIGIRNIEVNVVNPCYLKAEDKILAASTLATTADAMIADGIATREETSAAMASAERLVQESGSLITGPKTFQVFARRDKAGR